MNIKPRLLQSGSLSFIAVIVVVASVPEVSVTRDCNGVIVNHEVCNESAKVNLLAKLNTPIPKRIGHDNLNVCARQFVVAHPPSATAGFRAEDLSTCLDPRPPSQSTQRTGERRHIRIPVESTRTAPIPIATRRSAITLVAARLSDGECAPAFFADAIRSAGSTSQPAENRFVLIRKGTPARGVGLPFDPFGRMRNVAAAVDSFLARDQSEATRKGAGMLGAWHIPLYYGL